VVICRQAVNLSALDTQPQEAHMQYIPFISRGRGIARTLFFTLCLLTLVFASVAAAAGPGPGSGFGPALGPGLAMGGYTGPGPALVSVQQALSMQHNIAVSIKGKITQYLGRDDYTFTDSTGDVEVKIPPHAWMGRYVSESDAVELQGDVKKDRMNNTRIHVHRVVKR
jgi:uncharacterized protein (TIGR00156 family)